MPSLSISPSPSSVQPLGFTGVWGAGKRPPAVMIDAFEAHIHDSQSIKRPVLVADDGSLMGLEILQITDPKTTPSLLSIGSWR